MELHKAIREIVASRGPEMISNIQIINFLQDYQAFKEKPATKAILRDVIKSGYAEKVHLLDTKVSGWKTKYKRYQHDFINTFGYKEELVIYVFESIVYGLGKSVVNPKCKEIKKIHANHKEDSLTGEKNVQDMESNHLVSKDELVKYVKYNLTVGSSTQVISSMKIVGFNSIGPEFRQLQKMGIVSTEHMNILLPPDLLPAKKYGVLVRDLDEILKIINEYYTSNTNILNKEIKKCCETQNIQNNRNGSLVGENIFQDVEPKYLVSKDDVVDFVHRYLMFKSSVPSTIDESYRMFKLDFKQLQKMGIISTHRNRDRRNYSVVVRDLDEILRIIDEYYADYKEWR